MKRVLQLLALATIGFSAVACSGGSDTPTTPSVVKIGVDDASKLKKNKPADASKPADAKPGDAKPADAKPGDAKPDASKPADPTKK